MAKKEGCNPDEIFIPSLKCIKKSSVTTHNVPLGWIKLKGKEEFHNRHNNDVVQVKLDSDFHPPVWVHAYGYVDDDGGYVIYDLFADLTSKNSKKEAQKHAIERMKKHPEGILGFKHMEK